VLVGVARDPLEILELGYPDLGSSCLDCVYGVMRQHAQQYVLHPAVAVVYAWQALPDGTRGARLARIAVARTDAGLLLLGKRVQTDLPLVDFGPAFRDYLGRWAADVRLPVLSVREGYHQLGLDRGDVVHSSRTVGLRAEPAVEVGEFYADALRGYREVRLPFTVTAPVWEWAPPRDAGNGAVRPRHAPAGALAVPVVVAGPALPPWLLDGVVAAVGPLVLVGAVLAVPAAVVRAAAVQRLEDVHDRVEDLLDRIDADRDRVLRGAAPAELAGAARALDAVAAALRSPLVAAAPRRRRLDEWDSVALAGARLTAVRAVHLFLRQARGAASRPAVGPAHAAAVHALDEVPDPVGWTRRLRARVDGALAAVPARPGPATGPRGLSPPC
jgi:hypothetical protein